MKLKSLSGESACEHLACQGKSGLGFPLPFLIGFLINADKTTVWGPLSVPWLFLKDLFFNDNIYCCPIGLSISIMQPSGKMQRLVKEGAQNG